MTHQPKNLPGLVIAGHGSRDPDGIREFEQIVLLLRKKKPDQTITSGYLEFSNPTIEQAITDNINAGNKRIVMIPAILLAARHGKK